MFPGASGESFYHKRVRILARQHADQWLLMGKAPRMDSPPGQRSWPECSHVQLGNLPEMLGVAGAKQLLPFHGGCRD